MATIEEPLVPIYMYHRYAVESAASMVAGQDYIYGMRGDSRTPTKGVSVDDQRKALDALAVTLRPAELTVPEAGARSDSAAAAGLRHAPRAVPADDRRHVRSAEPGAIAADVTIGFVLQLDRAVADGGAACGQPGAARPRRCHRSADRGHLRCADDDAVRGGGPARGRARARRSRDVARRRVAERRRSGRSRRLKLSKLATRLKGASRRRKRTPRSASCSPPTSNAFSSGRSTRRNRFRCGAGCAARRADWRHRRWTGWRGHRGNQPGRTNLNYLMLVTKRRSPCIISPHVVQHAQHYSKGAAGLSLVSFEEHHPDARAAWRAALLLRPV